jgi:predicted dehydrogenase
MLDAADALDAVIVASPLHLHAEHNIGALERKLHVYGEKSLGFNIEHCDRIVKAVAQSGKRFQTGHQFRYDPAYTEALQRIKAGEIGRVTHIYGYWHRNGNWRRAVPNPKFERLINWRMYREYSGGLVAELGSHQIDLANLIYESSPESVVGNGGIDIYKDGRETYDNVQVTFRYPQGRTLFFSSTTNNAKLGYQITAYGDKGSVEFSFDGVVFYYEPESAVAPKAQGEIIERGVVTGATYSVKGERPYRGPGAPVKLADTVENNPNYVAVRSFINCIREDKRPYADEHAGHRSAISVYLANKAIDDERRINFADYVTRIDSTRK